MEANTVVGRKVPLAAVSGRRRIVAIRSIPSAGGTVMPSALAVIGSYAASTKTLVRTRLVAMSSSGVS